MLVTEAGFIALEKLMSEQKDAIAPEIRERALPSILARLHDTAIREACVLVESLMRSSIGSSKYGQKLIDEFFKQHLDSNEIVASHLKVLRIQTKTAFKFVRNEFIHNLKKITQAQCWAILSRISYVFQASQRIQELSYEDKENC